MFFFLFFVCFFSGFLFFSSELFILSLGFFMLFFYILFHQRISLDFMSEDEEISFDDEIDWYILMTFFIKFRNWYRFYARYIYLNLRSFYKFFYSLKKYFISWLRSIYVFLKRDFHVVVTNVVLDRLFVLEHLTKFCQYRPNSFDYLSL